MTAATRCTCQPGRDYDGSEFGPCEFCEAQDDAERANAAIMRDAARWRVTQIRYKPSGYMETAGFFDIFNGEYDLMWRVGLQPHPVTGATSINACILGEGKTVSAAIDGMFLSLDSYVSEGACLDPQLEAIRALAALSRAA